MDHITALMREYNAPMTRDEYLRWNGLGKTAKVAPEEEAELPARFAYPVITHMELASEKSTPKIDKGSGAPVDFSGPVFPNPNNVKPTLDTKIPLKKPKKMSGATMSIENPPVAPVEPNPLIPREQ